MLKEVVAIDEIQRQVGRPPLARAPDRVHDARVVESAEQFGFFLQRGDGGIDILPRLQARDLERDFVRDFERLLGEASASAAGISAFRMASSLSSTACSTWPISSLYLSLHASTSLQLIWSTSAMALANSSSEGVCWRAGGMVFSWSCCARAWT